MVESVKQAALVQQGWSVARTPALEETVTLQVALTLTDEEKLFQKLRDVSDPKSKEYGKYLDRDDVNAIIKPSDEANNAVVSWLKESGASYVHSDGTWVTFQTTVGKANELLEADFVQYQRDGVNKVRTTSYSVPAEIAQHIDFIHPTTFFGKTAAFNPVLIPRQPIPVPRPGKHWYEKRQTASCRQSITPGCLKAFYNVGNYTADPKAGSKIGFGSFLNESARYEDLRLYEQRFKIPSQNFTKIFVNNATDDQSTSSTSAGEANLDVQNIIGIAAPLPVYEFLTAGSPPFIPDLDLPTAANNSNEPYVPYYQFLVSKKNSELPQVISNSYGEPEHTVPYQYARRTCTLAAVLGLRGISVLESSGDTGIGSGCKANDGTNRTQFNPIFPATCPYITAVGGTESAYPEVAWEDSSGGFSYYFPRPWYQYYHVQDYLETGISNATLKYYAPYFNRYGRGFPDVAAHSLHPNYEVFVNNRLRASGGTSAAAPVWAGLIGLLNDARIRAGLPTLGFLNPWLYGDNDKFLVDITAGSAIGCDGINHQTGFKFEGAGIVPWASWNGTVGWDPATGLGIPDFQKMLKNVVADEK
ncbi:tripeptidyl peptidase A [Trichodelitschia bisporula]|uniref:tripeptidyl-peptidase II n=1 Tax=Trichodelitschia bisporula TaxID=703511 RepID=A0A6G1HW77_9PEZI|nr:tripeptidyl peptidase A [Trichodelitschia bisporula]